MSASLSRSVTPARRASAAAAAPAAAAGPSVFDFPGMDLPLCALLQDPPTPLPAARATRNSGSGKRTASGRQSAASVGRASTAAASSTPAKAAPAPAPASASASASAVAPTPLSARHQRAEEDLRRRHEKALAEASARMVQEHWLREEAMKRAQQLAKRRAALKVAAKKQAQTPITSARKNAAAPNDASESESESESEEDKTQKAPARRSLASQFQSPAKGKQQQQRQPRSKRKHESSSEDEGDEEELASVTPRKKARQKGGAVAPAPAPSPSPASSSSSRRQPTRIAKDAVRALTIADAISAEAKEEDKDDACYFCKDGGTLLVCDLCVHAYHPSCLESHHPDNFEVLKESAVDEEAPLNCKMLHLKCTSRRESQRLKSWAEVMEEEKEIGDVKSKWMGAPIHRSGGRKYYRAFSRGVDVYAIGSYVLLHHPTPPAGHPPYLVACIESLWEDLRTHLMWVEHRWCYLPEETAPGRLPHMGADEVFETAHVDENEVDCIDDLCDVLSFEEYTRRKEEDALLGRDDEEILKGARKMFFVRQRYDDDRGVFRPMVRDKKDRASMGGGKAGIKASPISSLGASSSSSAKSAKASSSSSSAAAAAAAASKQSIYAQACAQLQLSAAPPKLPCRDKEHGMIREFLERGIRRGYADGGLYIAGVPGTGKTATVQRVLADLQRLPDLPAFEFVEINGMRLPEPNQLYTALWKHLTGKQATPARAAGFLDQRFRTTNVRRPICVLLVDELDYIMTRQQHVLYTLFDWPGRRSARLLVVGISNTIDLPNMLMPRVHSRLGLTKMHFEPYTTPQIQEIVADRLAGLAESTFDQGAIELCARKIASISGDIRRALQICRRAAEMCEEEQMKKEARAGGGAVAVRSGGSAGAALVTADHIMSAISDLQNSSFILWLRNRAPVVLMEPLCLCALLSCMKFATGASAVVPSGRAGSRAAAAGYVGEENPTVSCDELLRQVRVLLDSKSGAKYIADASGVPVEAYPPPSLSDLLSLVNQWADVRLVTLFYTRGDRFPRIQLAVLTEDILHAYRDEPFWDKLRS